MAAKIDTAGGSGPDGTYYGSTTTSSTPRTRVKKQPKSGPFPGEDFDWEAAQSGEPYQAPRAAQPRRLRIMPDGSIVEDNSPWFYRASARDTQADWDYQRATTEKFLAFQRKTGTTLAPVPGSQPTAAAAGTNAATPGGNGPGGTPPFDPQTAAAAGAPAASTYQYRTWTELREDERDLFDTMADLFKAEYGYNSTGTSWYDQFVTDASKVRDRTGIAVDPANLAIQYANERGYDLKPWLEQSPYLSPNSPLFDKGSYARGGRVGVEAETPDSPSGPRGYPSGGGGGGYGSGGGGGSVALTNPTSARGLLLQTMQGVLGRNPTEREYKQFVKALSQAEMDAPQKVDVEGDVAVQSGGVDPGMVALEYVQGIPEFDSAEGQRAFSSFMQVLGA